MCQIFGRSGKLELYKLIYKQINKEWCWNYTLQKHLQEEKQFYLKKHIILTKRFELGSTEPWQHCRTII